MPCRVPPSELSAFIAKLLAKAEAFVINKVNEEVNKIREKLLGQICPPVDEIERLLKIRDNLVNMILGLKKKVEPVKKIADQMEPPIESARVVVTILQTIPIPTTIGGPGPIGVIFSIPIGVQNRYADLLRISCMIVENLSSDVEAIRTLANLTFSQIDPLLAKLQSIDIKLGECVEQMNEEDRNRILSSIDNLPSNLALAKGGDSDNNVFSYKNYTIKIVEDPNSPNFAKRRFAQVENDKGVVLMRGPSSFSSSTRILIDEIKFRINNQLP